MSLPARKILVLDFGSQVTHLICRRIRESSVYSELQACTADLKAIKEFSPAGVILSGGPASVYEDGSPHCPAGFWDYVKAEKIPVLGICYGCQEMVHALGGKVEPGVKREFGHAEMSVVQMPVANGYPTQNGGASFFNGLGPQVKVWMSHGDKVTKLPADFLPIGSTDNCEYAAVQSKDGMFTGLQFHPEVTHTPDGTKMIASFVLEKCRVEPTWKMSKFIDDEISKIQKMVGDGVCIGAISGGVDSTVCAALVHRALGKRFYPFMVDTGLLRKEEAKEVKSRLEKEIDGFKLEVIDASDTFYAELKDVTEPEKKRKIIGRLFIEQFEAAVKRLDLPENSYLLQGTLYPDVIESTSFKGPATTIKTHHNVGGLPARMKMQLCEPLRLLFKDEVRDLGRKLDLSEWSVMRHPFPGPGLGIRILDHVTRDRVACLQAADAIYMEELLASGEYQKIGQAFVVLLPTVRTVGVMGDHRTYEWVCSLRAVQTSDYMTADWYHLPYEVLGKVSTRIINEVKGINRVCFDISSKPPATIEWE
jgi:GMP synthase (glutamine-hydrolysing)